VHSKLAATTAEFFVLTIFANSSNSSLADDHYRGTDRKLCWDVTGKRGV